jgi:hypothetical protein
MIFDFLYRMNRVGSPAQSLRGSLRRPGPSRSLGRLSVPVRAVSWEPNREPADDLRGPTEAILRASELPSAPASALREVTHAADSRAVGKRTERVIHVRDYSGESVRWRMQISQF